ncbi:hypothetical protein [Haladaptatus sp. DYF46]|uniref:hypothetical protein n=1 Tax=Haladaptatus sp. DYF46 TaxID=2886041 RepID=UPI001E51AC97|nr:hypothetical protein [Haladaptatus sp. DYF46]
MTFRSDERGVTVQVGTVLLFATLVVAMSLYQATAIPSQNEGVEFRHNERVQGQMQDVRNAVLRTGATGTSQSTSVTLGTQYPGHVLFVNPPPASGTLRTTELGTLSVENLTAIDPETKEYFDESRHSFSTRALVYAPNYDQYGNAPDTVYENSVVYNRGRDGNATLTDQQLIQGKRITLVTLAGTLSRSRSGAISIDPRALSPSTETRTIAVRTNGSDPVIRVPTTLDAEKWKDLLAGQEYIRSVDPGTGDSVVVTLKGQENGTNVTYDLRMAKVGVGSGTTETEATYITNVSPKNASVDGTTTLVAEVRDEYNNPVSGVTVTRTDTGETETTDERGRVGFEYDAPESGTGTVTLSIGDSSREQVSFEIHTGEGTTSPSGSYYDVEWRPDEFDGSGVSDCNGYHACVNVSEGTTVSLPVSVTADDGPVTSATVDYAVNNSTLATITANDGTTLDGNDEATLQVGNERNGTITVYAASGDDVDSATIRLMKPPNSSNNGSGGGGPTNLSYVVTDNTDISENRVHYEVSYDVSNAGSSFDYMRVNFTNLDEPALTQTNVTNDTARGIIRYDAGYGQGDTYNITIQVVATNGSVLHSASVVDQADSTDPDGSGSLGGESSPALAGRWITDESDNEDGGVYQASYNVTNRSTFGHIEIEFRNIDHDWATQTKSSNDPRGRVFYSLGGADGDEYEIIFRIYDTSGVKVDEVSVSDDSDGVEPAGNEKLRNDSSPTLTNVAVDDRSSPYNSSFEVEYDVSDPDGTFGSVEVEFNDQTADLSRENHTRTTPSGTVQLDEYADHGNSFEIIVRVYDESGALVDEQRVYDTGDGTDP